MIINALWHNNNSDSALWNEYINTYNKEYLYIKSKYSLISTGTERLVATGKVPLDCFSSMQVPYMKGAFSLPIKYGYNLIGQADNSKHLVHLMHPHQDYCQVKKQDLNKIPDEIPPKRATLFGSMETVINAIWDARIDDSNRDKILIVGGGLIGMTLGITLQNVLNKEVYIHEINPFRRNWAFEHGLKLHESGHYPISFHTTSTGSGLQFAIDRLSYEGSVIEMSWYGSSSVSLNLGSTFHYNRKKIISSQVSHIPGHMQEDWTFKKRKQLAWKYLKEKCFDPIITLEIPFDEVPHFFKELRQGESDFLGCIIKY